MCKKKKCRRKCWENTHGDTWEAPPRYSSCHPPDTRLSSERQGRGGNRGYSGSSPGCWRCICLHGSCRCPQPGGFHTRQLRGDTQRNTADPLFKVWFMVVLCERCTIRRRKQAANLHPLCCLCWLWPKPGAHFKHGKAARDYVVCGYTNPASACMEPTTKLSANIVLILFLKHLI